MRAVLRLSPEYYGAAEGLFGIASMIGAAAAGLLSKAFKPRRLALVLAALGACLIPAGLIFLFPAGVMQRYAVITIAFCGVQAAASIFNIFSLSYIQQKTPRHLTGKVMSYISTITMCTQPLGQMIYGFLFDGFKNDIYFVLLPTGAAACIIGLMSTGFFKSLETE